VDEGEVVEVDEGEGAGSSRSGSGEPGTSGAPARKSSRPSSSVNSVGGADHAPRWWWRGVVEGGGGLLWPSLRAGGGSSPPRPERAWPLGCCRA
jgi:hypothetical protein